MKNTARSRLQFIFFRETKTKTAKREYVIFQDINEGLIYGDIEESDSNAATIAGSRILLCELHCELCGQMLSGGKQANSLSSSHKELQNNLNADWVQLWRHPCYYELQEFLCEQEIYNRDDESWFSYLIGISDQGWENLQRLRQVTLCGSDEITLRMEKLGSLDKDIVKNGGVDYLMEQIQIFKKKQETRHDTFIQFINKCEGREKFVPGRAYVPVNAIYKGIFKKKFEHWHTYNVALGKFPSDDQLYRSGTIIIPGSNAGAWEDLSWVKSLSSFLKYAHSSFPHLKFVGICFGFQILAQTFGGQVKQLEGRKKDPKFHVIGNEKLVIHQSFSSQKFVQDILPSQTCSLHINKGHGDYVHELPEDIFQTMAYSKTTPNEIAISRDQRMLGMQGHPEYSYEFSRRLTTTFPCQCDAQNNLYDWNQRLSNPNFCKAFSYPNDHQILVKIINRFIRKH